MSVLRVFSDESTSRFFVYSSPDAEYISDFEEISQEIDRESKERRVSKIWTRLVRGARCMCINNYRGH